MRTTRIAAVIAVVILSGLVIGQKYVSEPQPAAVEYLPDFTLPDLDDRQRTISEWSGRPMVINFWATWCGPCRREMPLLQSLQEEKGDGGLQVIGVALDNPDDVKRFIDKIGVTYPNLYGEHDGTVIAESLSDDFVGLPFSAFVAPGGEILALLSGELHADFLGQAAAEMEAVASGRRSVAEARASLSIQ